MSLLEDIFLEDEASEAQDLERVIEGDEFDERPRTPDSNDESEKDDEAEEDKRQVDHTAKAKRAVKNPRFVLNPARLTGPRGIQIIPEHFKDFKFKGKGHERDDLDFILKKLEHWAYRLYPKFKFDDCLKKIETLGKKRPVMVHLHKIRTDQFMSEETVVQRESSGDEAEVAPAAPQQEDEFDRLLQQQIELARATPAPGSVRKEMYTPVVNRSPLIAPKATSSPSISDEQKERMIKNRKLAEDRRLARLKQLNNSVTVNDNSFTEANTAVVQDRERMEINEKRVDVLGSIVIDNDVTVVKKHNRSNVIDSSDEESDVMAVNQSITVDIHKTVENGGTNSNKKNNDMELITVDNEINVDEAHLVIESESNFCKINMSTVIENDSNELQITDETLSNNHVVPEVEAYSEIVEGDLLNDKPVLNCELDSVDKANFSNDKNENVYESTNNEKQSKDESNDVEKVTDYGVSVTEDLMDVDFSDDF